MADSAVLLLPLVEEVEVEEVQTVYPTERHCALLVPPSWSPVVRHSPVTSAAAEAEVVQVHY